MSGTNGIEQARSLGEINQGSGLGEINRGAGGTNQPGSGTNEALVFPSAVGTNRQPKSLYDVLCRIGEQVGIDFKIGPQVLRRTFNTLQQDLGTTGVVLRSQTGHSSEAMTQRYTGVAPEKKQAAVERMMRAVGGDPAPDAPTLGGPEPAPDQAVSAAQPPSLESGTLPLVVDPLALAHLAPLGNAHIMALLKTVLQSAETVSPPEVEPVTAAPPLSAERRPQPGIGQPQRRPQVWPPRGRSRMRRILD